jgi:hypothetical protein
MGPGLLESIYERCLVQFVDGISKLVLSSANKPRTKGNEGNEVWEPSLKRRQAKKPTTQNRLKNTRLLSPSGAVGYFGIVSIRH